MPGSSTTPGRLGARVHAPIRVAFRIRNGVGTRDNNLCEAQWLACAFPYRRFAAVLTDDRARLGADVVSYSFTVSDLHRLLVAGLPAHCERLWTLPGAQAQAAPQPRNRSSARPLAGSRHRLGAADGILLACKVRDQIADNSKLFDIIVSNFNVEAILNGNHQLDAVEKVSAEIVNKMAFACYKTGIDVQMFRDKKAIGRVFYTAPAMAATPRKATRLSTARQANGRASRSNRSRFISSPLVRPIWREQRAEMLDPN